MAQFLSTRGLGHQIEEIITSASVELIIITPYLKFSLSLYERLLYVSRKGIKISVVYGKSELDKDENQLLRALNCNIYYKDNLHAKCYLNESAAIVGSMNLYEYSEINNEEMGVLISDKKDKDAFLKCKDYVSMIIESAEKKRVLKIAPQNDNIPEQELDYKKFNSTWETWLLRYFKNLRYEKKGSKIYFYNYLDKGVIISNTYGFVTIELPLTKEVARRKKESNFGALQTRLNSFRCYWSSPFNKICLYQSDSTGNVKIEIEKCSKGVEELMAFLNEFEII